MRLPFSIRKGNIYFVFVGAFVSVCLYLCVCVCVCSLLEEGFSDLLTRTFSKFTHDPLTVKVVEFIQEPYFWNFLLACRLRVDKFMALTSEPRHMSLFGYILCGCFVPTENIIKI
jgi:hypothetical protein